MNNNDEIKQTVYISFNINDSDVSSFIRYLVAALHREGIDVASEKSGHDLNKGWFSRIKLFVVVFSKPCTYSVACLEKLVKLLEFLREEDNVVVPVFNDAMAKQMDRRNFLERLRHWESLILQISEAAELIEEIQECISEAQSNGKYWDTHAVTSARKLVMQATMGLSFYRHFRQAWDRQNDAC
ncbi:unnamed protein product [Brassica rapa]|uniref:TIR domain-containing protein n=1 Tax=Brassica campestris TaxID=3711 RepID=A0A8D9M1B8_BRACM|nr:unnamed protein product [Brassica rapa]